MNLSMISRWTGAAALVCMALGQTAGASGREAAISGFADAQGKDRPKAALRVTPAMIIPPGRIVATVELTGGSNDFQDYYCPSIQWEWGDGSQSETAEDCDPYVAGKSEIRRRYTTSHEYKSFPLAEATGYEVLFRMKQGTKVVLLLKQNVRARGN